MSTAGIFGLIVIVCLMWLVISLLIMGLCRIREPKWPKYPLLNIKKRLEHDRAELARQQSIAEHEAKRQERRRRKLEEDTLKMIRMSIK